MKNAAILCAHGRLAEFKRQLAATARQLARLAKLAETLDAKIRVLDRVSEIADGIALDVAVCETRYGHDYEVRAVADDIHRTAQVYTNACTQKDFGLHLYDRSAYPSKEHWCGTGFRWADAVALARRWVTWGGRPHDGQIKMYQALGKLDPKGALSETRRLAFEAAWIAGHRDLAGQFVQEGP
jgi:hypothetical protein